MKIPLDEIIKSINPKTNNKSSGNDGLTAEFYKDFSNELASVLFRQTHILKLLRVNCKKQIE